MIFLSIIWTLFKSLWDICWKKSLWYWVWWKIHDLIWYFPWIFVSIYFLIIQWNILNLELEFFILCSSLLLITIWKALMYQKVYREEKMSSIMPFTNLSKVFAIIAWFFLFNDSKVIVILIWMLIILILAISSIDFKDFSIPKNIKKIFLWEVIIAVSMIWNGYMVNQYWNENFFFWWSFIWAIMLMIWAIISKELGTVKNQPKAFWINRFLWWLFWWTCFYFSLIVLKELWISVSIILSFVYVAITLVLSTVILKEKPAKKDIFMSILVTSLVWLAYYLNN